MKKVILRRLKEELKEAGLNVEQREKRKNPRIDKPTSRDGHKV